MTITDLYSEHGVDFRRPGEHHHAHGAWVQADCPYCSPGWQHFRLGFNTRRRTFNCWACGPHRTGETLSLLLNVPPDEAMRLARGLRAGDDNDPHIRAVERRGTLVIPPGVGPLTFYHRRYLRRCGFVPSEVIKTWEVEGIGIGGYLSWRIFIPIHDKSGKPVSWTTRAVSKNPAKRYLRAKPSQEEVNANYLLYGEHRVKGHSVVVHEGPTDAWATGPGAVALMGLTISMQQVFKIAQYPLRVICFDNEPEAQKRADFLCDQLSPFPGETVRVRLEHGKDAAKCLLTVKGRAELRELRDRFLNQEALYG